jgi:hypothetical protein
LVRARQKPGRARCPKPATTRFVSRTGCPRLRAPIKRVTASSTGLGGLPHPAQVLTGERALAAQRSVLSLLIAMLPAMAIRLGGRRKNGPLNQHQQLYFDLLVAVDVDTPETVGRFFDRTVPEQESRLLAGMMGILAGLMQVQAEDSGESRRSGVPFLDRTAVPLLASTNGLGCGLDCWLRS